jgi:cell division protein FtsQ
MALVVGVAVGVALSPLLDVESVAVTGVTPDRVATVQRAAGIDVGDPILGVLPGRAAGRVRGLPWVRTATVVRDLPSGVRIEVVPRIPVGWVRAGTGVLVVDAGGRVIERRPEPTPGVPELTGIAELAPVGGQVHPVSLPAAAGALGAELRSRVGSLHLEDGGLRAQVAFGPEVRFGPPERMTVKARVAAAVLASLGSTPVAYVDVSVPAAPVSG